MAEFGTKITDLGKSNYQGYVKQGVVDKSKAIDTASKFDVGTRAAQAGFDAYETYDKNKTLSGVSDAINEVVSEQQARSIQGQQELAQGIMADQSEIESQKKAVGYDGTYPTALNSELSNNIRSVTNALAEKTDVLTKAKEQGAMDSFELTNRLAKITREAMAANPAYASEIMAHVSQVSAINNLTARVAEDKAIIDAQQADDSYMRKKLITKGYELGFNPDSPKFRNPDGSENLTALSLAIDEKLFKLNGYNELKMSNQMEEELDKKSLNTLMDTGRAADMNEVVATGVDAELQAVLASDDTKKEITMQKIVNGGVEEAKRMYIRNGISLQDPRVKDYITALETRMSAMQKLYTDRASGKTTADQFKNELDILQNTNSIEFLKKHPALHQYLPYLDMIKDFSALAPGGKELGVDIQTRIIEGLAEAFSTTSVNVEDPENTTKNNSFGPIAPGKPSAYSLRTMKELNLADNSPENRKAFVNTLKTRTNFINLEDDTADPTKQMQEIQYLIKDLANPKMKEGISYIKEPEVLSNLSGIIEEYKVPLANGIKRFKEQFPEAELTVNAGNGMLMIKNPKPQHRKFMQGDLKSINETFEAYNNINGLSAAKSADSFYSDILGVPSEKK